MKSKDINYIDKTMRGTCCEAMKLAQVDLMLKLYLGKRSWDGWYLFLCKKEKMATQIGLYRQACKCKHVRNNCWLIAF